MSVPPRKYPQSAPAPTLPIASADADWSDGSSTFYDGSSETSASSSSPSEVQLRHHRPVLPPPLPLSSPKHQQYHHPSTITTASVDSIALPPKYSNWSEQMCDEIRHIATNDEVYKEILPWQKVKDPFDVNNVHWETSTHAYWPHQDSTRSSEFLDPAVVSHLDSLSAVDQSRRAPLARPESGFMIPKSQSEIAQESDSPPPLPVRLRRPLATSPTTHTESNLRIYPVKVDGKQMSHTHYWLIPPPTSKQSPLPSNNNNNNLHSPLSSLTSPTLADSLMTNSCMAARVTEPHPMPDMRRYSGVYHNVAQASSKTPTPSSGPVPNATNSAPETQANPVFANLQDTLKHLMNLVNGASEKDARSALNHCKGHIPSAIAHLQVEQLHRLGLTHVSRDVCRKYLEKYNWDMEQAAAALVDRYCDSSGSRV